MNLLCYLLFYSVALPGGAARYASTCRLVFESQELTDIQEDVGLVKNRFY